MTGESIVSGADHNKSCDWPFFFAWVFFTEKWNAALEADQLVAFMLPLWILRLMI
jgi:hypothetical protein